MSSTATAEKEKTPSFESTPATTTDDERKVGSTAPTTLAPHDDFPDGGYGWVVVACCFTINAMTWGLNTGFSVFFSFYRQNNYFPGTSAAQYAFVGSSSLALALLLSPFADVIAKKFHFKVSLWAGLCCFVLSSIFAGLSKHYWQLFLSQGILFSFGLCLLFTTSVPITSQWFLRRRALANGLCASGSGCGALLFSFVTRSNIQNYSLKWAFFINAFISTGGLVPAILLLRTRIPPKQSRGFKQVIQYDLIWRPGLIWIYIWGALSVFGYVIALYTLATFGSSGLGLPQSRAAALQGILGAGQMLGRPIIGLSLDVFGRVNMASFASLLSGFSCLFIWMFARNFGVTAFFAFVQGFLGGTMWGSAPPVLAECVHIQELPAALSLFWVALMAPALLSQPSAVWIIEREQKRLHTTDASAYLSAIGLSGTCFVVAGIVLLGTKRHLQGDWTLWKKC